MTCYMKADDKLDIHWTK